MSKPKNPSQGKTSGDEPRTNNDSNSGSETKTLPITSIENSYNSSRINGIDGGRKSSPITSIEDDNPEPRFLPDDFISDEWIGKIYTDPKRLSLYTKTVCFHNLNGKGDPVSVNDLRVYRYLTHTQHIFVCENMPYVYRGGYYHEDPQGVIIKSLISDCILEQFVKSTTNDRIFKLFLQKEELVMSKEDLNSHSPWYINFENGMFDVKRGVVFPHTPTIYSINQIPWSYDPTEDPGPGTEIEKFISNAIPKADDREMLLEYMGLCCTTDNKQQKMLVICGEGGTGKSTMINLIQTIVGKRNISNVALSELMEKFTAVTMMGKLLNACADLEINALDDVTKVKKLVGEDMIMAQHKGKPVFFFENYAKMLFSTNELPLVRNEKTEGFYRRLMVLGMNEKPKRVDPELKLKLEKELPYLIDMCMKALKRMYDRGYILESKGSKEKVNQLRKDSDTIEAFLSEVCEVTHNGNDRTSRGILFEKYAEYCKEYERQAHTKNNFYAALRKKGYIEVRSNGGRFFMGLKIRKEDDSDGFIDISQAAQDVGDLGELADVPFTM